MPNRSYVVKSFLFVAIFFLHLGSTFSQCDDPISFHIEDYREVEGETVCMDVRVRGFQDMSLMLIPISFDPSILQYARCENGPNFIYDCESLNTPEKLAAGIFQIFWSSPSSADNLTLADDDILITLCFEVIGEVGNCTKIIPGDVPALGTIPAVIMEIFKGDCNDPIIGSDVTDSEIGDFKVTCGSFDAGRIACPSGAGSNNGNVRFTLCGDEGPYNYELITEANDVVESGQVESLEEKIIENLGAGTYTLVVSTVGGVSITLPGGNEIVIIEGVPMDIDIATTGPTCAAANPNGTIEATVTGGNPDYTFKWSTTGVNINPITGLTAGDYSLTVTDESGCQAIEDNIVVDFNSIQLDDLQVTPAVCPDSRTGSVTLDISGGVPELRRGGIVRYRVSINGENSFPYVQPPSPIPLEAGDYTVRIFDNSSPREACFIDATFTIETSKDYEIDLTSANNDCTAGGIVNVNTRALAGSAPLSSDLVYNIFDVNGLLVQSEPSSDLNFTFSGLPEGNYTVSVVDNEDGCIFRPNQNDGIRVPPTSGTGIPITAEFVHPSCGNPGSIIILGLGDPTDYTYSWNRGDIVTTTNELIDLPPGNYNVEVTEIATGCTGTFDSQVQLRDQSNNLDIDDANDIDPNQLTPVGCENQPGAITIDINDPILASEATFVWYRNDIEMVGETGPSISGLDAATYRVELSGPTICPTEKEYIMEPGQPLVISVEQPDVVCFGENVDFTLMFANATGNVSFEIQNMETGEILPERILQPDRPSGTYLITALDERNCPADLTYTVETYPEITLPNINPINNSCFGETGGFVSINPNNIAGGSSDQYFLVWSTDPGNPSQTQTSISDLENGEYSLLVYDDNVQCESELLEFEITSPPQIEIDNLATVINQPSCYGDSDGVIDLAWNGGSGNLDFIRVTDIETGDVLGTFNTNQITGLDSSNYLIQIRDDTGCFSTAEVLSVGQPDSLSTEVDSAAVVLLSCNGEEIGIIRTIHSGGNDGIITYTWSHDGTLNSPVAANLGEDIYTLAIEDSKGCTAATEYEMQSPQPITLSNFDTVQFVQCFGDRLQFGGLEPSGGNNTGYRFAINNGNLMQITDSIALSAGRYDLEIRDQDGCPLDTSFVISEPSEVVVELGPDVEINLGDSHTLRAEHDPEEVVISYMWDPLEADESQPGQAYTVTPMDDTVYGVIIENDAGCTDEDEVMIRVRRDRNIYIPNVVSTNRNDTNSSFAVYAGQGVELIEYVRIFDRWGNLVHNVEQLVGNPLGTGKWDARHNGTLVEAGVYVYIAKVRFTDGEILNFKGNITVVH